ncbi:uncharacterized protein LOC131008673 [Salvia miltiorrhiza]|uniref:uncharacterized protein LOC131008673 n=1 Tax=Salvia miltiorrhiza TaxID=226208 RepID=UPI0025AB827B|nr:uncharacterized protein LOC131008673 [Salvia miltiorrhiza]
MKLILLKKKNYRRWCGDTLADRCPNVNNRSFDFAAESPMATHMPSSSPNKRLKTLSPISQSPIRKGKSIAEEEPPPPVAQDEAADCCGICLSEAGVSRGHIECCDHYYCFVCIMEWAKVESKCPLCKRRFSTITRPPKPPVFPSERVVHVPLRDQACHYFGTATNGHSDMYAEAKCAICQGMADESFLLLCDLCDSAAHTYCVGLGYTVPEGDWFCLDCTLLRDEHLKSESSIDSDVQTSLSSVDKISTSEHISILDIVQESRGRAVQSSGSASLDRCYSTLPNSTDEVVTKKEIKRSSSTSPEVTAQHPMKLNARTLQHCRNLQDRIRILRQNWNGFRSGVFQFSSNRGKGSISQNSVTYRSGDYSVSCLNQQSIAQCSSSDVKNDARDHEIQKAWKMFDKAKSIRPDHVRSYVVRPASKFPTRKPNPNKSANCVSNMQVSVDSQQNRAKKVESMGAVDHNRSDKNCYEQPSSSSGKGMPKLHVVQEVTYSCDDSTVGHSPAHQELRSSKETPSHLHSALARSMKLPAAETFKRPHCVGSDASGPVVPNTDQVNRVNHASSSHSKVKHAKEKRESDKIYVDSQQYNAAKSEIQSLVKLNLKLQTKEKLGVDAFKDIARLSTHSILAGCGLEHPRPGLPLIPGIVCSHHNNIGIGQHQKSSLMPCSCRECFYVYVKDVVNSVVLQKKKIAQKLP